LRSAPGKEQYVRASYAFDDRGPCVTPVGGHGSHLIGDLAQANAIIAVPAEADAVAAGTQVDVLVLDREF
jgi:molybdopterin molybdotransferase